MLAILLLALGTISIEISNSMGKVAVGHRIETVYSMGFLGLFWATVFFALTPLLGVDFYFSAASLPTVLARVALEILLAHLGIKAIATADRTTVGFLLLLTIPLLLGVDLIMGYQLTSAQITGMAIILLALMWLFGHNPKNKPGAKLVIAVAFLGVITTSLYKYHIENFNSVSAEQLIVTSSLLIYFGLFSSLKTHEHPIHMLFRPFSGIQSITHGIGVALISFSYLYAAPSVIITLKRALTLLWSIFSGRFYFHEQKLGQKMLGFIFILIGMILLAIGS